MPKKLIVVGGGKGTLAMALAAATGTPVAETPQEPTITYEALLETEVRNRAEQAPTINEFREVVRRHLPRIPELRDEFIALASRFSAHPGHGKLTRTLTAMKDEMDKPEFEFGDPARLQRWINWMMNRPEPVESTETGA